MDRQRFVYLRGLPMRALGAVLALAGLVSMVGCSVFGVRDTPQPEYEVLKASSERGIEVREYAPMLVARTEVEADDYDDASEIGFRRLADYIFGANQKGEEIGMTAPVYQKPKERPERDGEKIGMTAPVYQKPAASGGWQMTFVMPSRYTKASIPKPKDQRIDLVEVPARRFAVIRFDGVLDDEDYRKKSRELLGWIEASEKYRAVGEPMLAGYDPPFTLPMFRRNEVLVEVEGR